MQVLTDAQWAKFEAAIAAVNIRGARPRIEDRRTIEAIIWRLDNGAKWRSIPAELGPWHHAYLRFRRWGRARRVGCDYVPRCRTRRATTGVRLHRRDDRASPSKGLGCMYDQIRHVSLRFNRNTATQAEALGRSRGGLGTKIVGICDAAGRLVDFLLLPGQAHELAPSLTLLKRLPEAPDWALADMACDAREFPRRGPGDGCNSRRTVTQGCQGPATVPVLHLSASQPDRTMLGTSEGAEGHRHPI